VRRSLVRLLVLFGSIPVSLVLCALLYQIGMEHLEETPRTFIQSLEWSAETVTTTGYGRDNNWKHPAMQVFVILVQFGGLFLVFLAFPIFVLPFFEERFQARLPKDLPALDGQVLIYRYGPAVESLIDHLESAGVPVVVFEAEETVARRLHERGRRVVYANLDADDPDLSSLHGARGLVANGADRDNAAITIGARARGFGGPIVALIERPEHRAPMLRAGADASFTPSHLLAAAICAKASTRMSPRVSGMRHLGGHLEIAEVRVPPGSPLAGRTLAEAGVRARTGATVIGAWIDGLLVAPVVPGARLAPGTILVVAGSQESLARLTELAIAISRRGAFLLLGHGETGRKVAELLRASGETVHVVSTVGGEGVDSVGDPLDEDLLVRAGAHGAQAILVALENDSETLFTTAVVRNLDPDVSIIASVIHAEHVARIRRAGADFAISVSQVAGELLSYQILGEESVSLDAEIKVVSTSAGRLAGRPLSASHVRAETGCQVVAIERGDDVIVEFDDAFVPEPGDVLYLAGDTHSVARYLRLHPDRRGTTAPRAPVVEP